MDGQQDKGIDGIYVNDTTETVHLIQVKTKQSKKKNEIGDTEIKEFYGSVQQFKDPKSIQAIIDSNANDDLKRLLRRNKVSDKIESGYRLEGVFVTNANLNADGKLFSQTISDEIVIFDANKISAEFVTLDAKEGVNGEFTFDVSDADVISYDTAETIKSRIFLAKSLQLTHLEGISDGSLFEKNVRYSLGNTKINKGLIQNLRNSSEHGNFPLYHNGITILCNKITAESDETITIQNYVVVNGAQSLTALFQQKAKLSDDLRLLVKIVEVQGDNELADKITNNSNNQNAIKARDMRSNNNIQARIQREVDDASDGEVLYEVKRGEKSQGKEVLPNDSAGLILLAMDIGEPWNCHQKYKVMDESHSKIFGRPDVTGDKVYALYKMFEIISEAVDNIDDDTFANYTLTKYFLAFAVCDILRTNGLGKKLFSNFKTVIEEGKLDDLLDVVGVIAGTTADDLNAEYEAALEESSFDYKAELKSPNWCRATAARLRSQHAKDVKRKKADSIDTLLQPILE